MTSVGHHTTPGRFSDYNFMKHPDVIPITERPYRIDRSRGTHPKGDVCALCILWTVKISIPLLGKYLTDQGVRSFAVHPVSIWTDFGI